MTDEQIADYLRSRTRVTPPMDLVAAIGDAIADVPQRRRSWFAPFVPAAAAVAATAAVLVAAILAGQGPDTGPAPGGSPTEEAVPTPLLQQSPPPSLPPLVEPGDTATIAAADTARGWGTVTLTRGADVGGYDDGSVAADSFVVEIHVEYLADRLPEPLTFGAPDWTLTAGADGVPVGDVLEPDGRVERDRPSLATYPGAIDIFANPLEGWLLFVVPRDLATEELELVYRPAGLAEPAATFLVRLPEPAPDPVAIATPGPTPAPVDYVTRPEYPFDVIDHPEADELFATPDTCTNPVDGYTITYPDAWFTNTEIGDWPPCSWFSPTFYDVGDDENAIPPQVAIVVTVDDTSYGFVCDPERPVNDEVTVSGFAGSRSEQIGCTQPAGEYVPQPAEYTYTIVLNADPAETPTMRAWTSFEGAADYELNKAVLDRIMGLIEFDEAP